MPFDLNVSKALWLPVLLQTKQCVLLCCISRRSCLASLIVRRTVFLALPFLVLYLDSSPVTYNDDESQRSPRLILVMLPRYAEWSCAVRCAAFLVHGQITLASPRVHMFRFFPAESLGVLQPASVFFNLLAEVTDARLRSAVSHVWRWMIHLQTAQCGERLPGHHSQCCSWGWMQVQQCLVSPVLSSPSPSGAGVSAERSKVSRCAEIQRGTPWGSLRPPLLLVRRAVMKLGRYSVPKHLIPAHTAQEWRWLCFCLMWDGAGQKYRCHP